MSRGLSLEVVAGVQLALLDSPSGDGLPHEVMRADLERLTERRQAYQLEDAARIAARLLTGLRISRAAGGREVPEVLRLLVWTCYETRNLIRDLGYPDLALLADGVIQRAAEELAEPALLAVAAFARTHALAAVGTAAFDAAVDVGTSAADAVRPVAGTEALAAYGSLHLAVGFAFAAAGRAVDSAERLAAAQQVALRATGRSEVGRHLAFGVANVGVHRVSAALELSEPDQAVRAAGQVTVADIPYAARRASFWADLGRAHAALGHDDQAVVALRRAEHLAPLRVRLHPLVREAVAGMVGRAQRAAVGRDLRGLAYRMGVPH
ncbi:MAG: hypothetical protein HY241_01570 [Actinobacteria bacterium]|nr:hypothetical protein [Actinomycetota bacterium]